MKRYSLLLSALLLCTSFASEKEVLLVHNFTAEQSEEIFNPGSPYRILQDAVRKNHIQLHCLKKDQSPLYTAKEKKHTWQKKLQDFLIGKEQSVAFSDDPCAYLVFWNLPSDLSLKEIKKVPADRLILFAFEPPVVLSKQYSQKTYDAFSKVYTWDDDLVDDKKFFKFFLPVLTKMSDPLPGFFERKLCALVAANKSSDKPQELYSARRTAIKYFETKAPNEFSFYGPGWNAQEHPSYNGVCADKIDTLKKYRFSICYENMQNVKGYISEKIFDCFSAGCVPIYWGASNIEAYIPKHCFIDIRRFRSYDELYSFIANMSEDTYNTYVNNIRAFLQSKEAKVFSIEHFTQIFSEAIQD